MTVVFAGGLQRKVQALATAARLQEGVQGVEREAPQLDDASLAGIFTVLQEQANWLSGLQVAL